MKYNLFVLIITIISLTTVSCEITESKAKDSVIKKDEIKVTGKDNIEIISSVPKSNGFYDISDSIAFLPDLSIWVKGGWNSYPDRLYYSNNQGKTWESKKIPVDSISVDGDIYFSDIEHGWAIGWVEIVATIDGGKTWKKLEVPKESNITKLQTLQFFDSQLGFVGGTTSYLDRDQSQPVIGLEILCTMNGGENFRVCYKTNNYRTVFQIITVSNNEVIALLDGIALLITQDKGETWKEIKTQNKLKDISKANNKTIWSIDTDGIIRYSQDSGQSWNETKISDREQGNWNSIAFNDSGRGIAVGKYGKIAITYDNGLTWNLQKNLIDDDLLNVKLQSLTAIISSEKKLYFVELK